MLHRRSGRSGALVLMGIMALSAMLPTAALAGPPSGPKLDKHDRELLAEARAQGRASVTLLIASKPGGNNQVASGLASLGASVRYRENDMDGTGQCYGQYGARRRTGPARQRAGPDGQQRAHRLGRCDRTERLAFIATSTFTIAI